MKHLSAKGLMIVLSLLFFYNISFTQSHLFCGTDHDDISYKGFESKAEFQRYLKFEKKFLENYQSKSANVDTVYLHQQIVRLDANTPAITIEEIDAGMAYMNEHFINSNVIFETAKVTYIDDDSMYEFEEEDDGDKTTERLTPGMVDIFYANTVSIRGNKVGGFAGGSRIVAASAGGSLLTHEMGHIFGLAHTHGKYGFEPPAYGDDVNGFPHQVYIEGAVRYYNENRDDNGNGIYDCYETGDNVCDTPAEYVLLNDVRCYVSGEQMYTGNQRDYFGDRFEPELGNEMSYGCDGNLTPGQYARMRYIFDTQLLYLQCSKCRDCDEPFVVNKNDNIGKNTFTWAVQCADVMDNDVTKNIVFDVPGGIIELQDRSYNTIERDNFVFSSKNGNIILDGSQITDGARVGFRFKGNNITVENIHFKDLVTGINFSEDQENLVVRDCIFEEVANTLLFNRGENLIIEGNQILSSNLSGISIEDGKDVLLKNNKITNARFNGIAIDNCEQCIVESNEILDINNHGIFIGGSDNLTISNNIIGSQANRQEANGAGILFSGGNSQNVLIDSNTIEYYKWGLYMWNAEYDKIDITNNDISNNITVALNLQKMDRTNIIGNVMSKNGSGGPSVREGRDIVFSDNVIESNSGIGLRLAEVRNAQVIANEIIGNDSYGAYMENCNEVTVGELMSKNLISKNISGLYFSRTRDVSILNNDIIDNMGHGVLFNFTDDVIIGGAKEASNNISKNNGSGISSNDVDGLIVQSNIIDGNLESGIKLSRNENVIIGQDASKANTISNNGELGISLFSTQDFQHRGNLIFCNGSQGISTLPKDDDLINKFIIEEVQSNYVSGTGESGYTVEVYTNPGECEGCQFEKHLGTVEVNRNGEWELDISDHEFAFGEGINIMIHSDTESWTANSCQISEIGIGCFNEESELPYAIDFEQNEFSSFKVVGSDFSNYDWSRCNENDDYILGFNARNPESDKNILFTNSFDLINIDTANLVFDVAHKGSYSNRETFLKIGISTDCGASFETIFDKTTYNGLLTESSGGNFDIDWEPTSCDAWRTEVIDLNKYIGENISFRIEAGALEFWGQNLYLDNLNLNVVEGDKCATRPAINDLPSSIVACAGEDITLSTGNSTDQHTWSFDGEQIEYTGSDLSVTQSGEYNVIIAGEDECNSEKTIIVEVNPVPTIEFNGETTFCEGDNSNVTVISNATRYVVSLDDEIITDVEVFDGLDLDATVAGKYTVEVTSDKGCTNEQSIELETLAKPALELTIEGELCEGSSALISAATDADEVLWWLDNDPIEVGSSHSASRAGEYVVSASFENLCSTEASVNVPQRDQPMLDVILPEPVCEGATSEIFLVTDASLVEWLKDGEVISNEVSSFETTTSGTYLVKTISDFGCTNQQEITIENLETPTANFSSADPICQGESTTLVVATDATALNWFLNGVPIDNVTASELQVSEGGTYEVLASNENGCSASDKTVVEVGETPTLELSIPDPVCETKPSQVSVMTDGAINEWQYLDEVFNTKDENVTIKYSGNYVVSVVSAEGCLKEMSFTIENFRLPPVSLSVLDAICEGDTASLTVTTDASIIEWRLEDEPIIDQTGKEILVTDAGTYIVVVTDENGCEAFANSVLEYIECSTPTIEIEDTDIVQMFPNPAQDELTILLSEGLVNRTTYKIFNNVGALVKYGSLNIGTNKIELLDFVSGTYSVIVEDAEDVYTSRLIVLD